MHERRRALHELSVSALRGDGGRRADLARRGSSGGLATARMLLSVGAAPLDDPLPPLGDTEAGRLRSDPSAFSRARALLAAGPAGAVDNVEEL